MIAHVDADCFFVSVELLSRPELRGKPVLVCNRNDGRGIVTSASYEARPFGIGAGTPVFKAKKLCPQGIFIPSHFEQYNAVSYRLMEILRDFSPDVEPYSIDEAYVDLTGLRLLYRSDYPGIAEKIQKTVFEKLGITVSIGLASTKLLAKIASDFKKPNGITVVQSHGIETFLKNIPMRDIPGIGKNTEALLMKLGLKTALDVASSPKIPEILGKRGREFQQELNGNRIYRVEAKEMLPKSLSKTSTFPDFSSNRNAIHNYSLKLLLCLSRRLRSYNLEAGLIGFFLMSKNFEVYGLKQKLPQSSDEDHELIPVFEEMFNALWKENTVFRKSGFFFDLLRLKKIRQLNLFEKDEKSGLSATVDKINLKFGSRGVLRGSFLKGRFLQIK